MDITNGQKEIFLWLSSFKKECAYMKYLIKGYVRHKRLGAAVIEDNRKVYLMGFIFCDVSWRKLYCRVLNFPYLSCKEFDNFKNCII